MTETSGSHIFTAFTILLISGTLIEGSPHNYLSLRSSSVSLNACPAFPISPTYCSFVGRAEENSTLEGPCQFTLPQYACGLAGQVSNLTAGELTSALQCSIANPEAQLDQGAFLLLFGDVDLHTLQEALDDISVQVPRDEISTACKAFLLNAAWEKLKMDPRVQSTGFLASWFQETLHSYLTTINPSILDCMSQLPISCDGFTTIVQSLDSVYSGMTNATRQMVATWIAGFLTMHGCQRNSAKEWIQSNWKNFLNYASYNDLTKTWNDFDGFAALEVLTAAQVAQMTVARGILANVSLADPVAQVLRQQDLLYLGSYLDELAGLPLDPPLDPKATYLMLETILTKVKETFPDLCSPSLKDLFQIKLTRLLPAADEKTLELFPTQIGCNDFRDIYKGLDTVYHELSPVTQMAVFKQRLNFLEGQLAKEGAACTFTVLDNRQWLEDNFGLSRSFADYSDFLRLNPSFNGVEVLDLLTAPQIGTLVVISGILTDEARANADMEATAVMESFQGRNISELQSFLHKVNTLVEERNIGEISNVKVRDAMFKGIFQFLLPHLASTESMDFGSWFEGILTLYLPSITADQLERLPSLSNCTQLQAIVKGLDKAFDPMTLETKIGVAQWIVRSLQKIDCQGTENWLSLHFQRFKAVVNITDLMALDPNFNATAYLGDLSPVQLGQLTATEGVLSSMSQVEKIFAQLSQFPTLEELAAYWDEFNIAYEKANQRDVKSQESRPRIPRSLPQSDFVNISMQVGGLMLTKTMERLRSEFPAFTDADYQLWFGKRLVLVLPSVTAAVLKQIPANISCEAYKSVIGGLNSVFSEIPLERRMEVVNYIIFFLTQKSQTTGPACSDQSSPRNWLLELFGKFSTEVPYSQLVSYYRQPFDAYTVLDLLTASQIADMIVQSQTLTSLDLAMRLVDFFEENNAEDVQTILKELTKAANKQKVVNLPNVDVAWLLLTEYLALASPQMESYSASDWNATFQEELRFLAFSANATTLAYLVPQNYDSYTAIIAGFNGVHAQMSEPSKRDLVLWIVQNLKAFKESPKEPIEEWIQSAWGSFFQDATLEEVKSTNKDFDPLLVLNVLGVDQLVELVPMSDALDNVTTMNQILSSLETGHSKIPLSKMDEFLMAFNLMMQQGTIPGFRNPEVRLEMLTTMLMNLARYFNKFTDLDYQAWFTEKLRFLLPGINGDLLQLIPLDLNFPSYKAIFGGLDQVYPELPEQTSRHIYDLMKMIMEGQLNVSGTAFPGAYNNSQSFLEQIFYRFRHFATYADLLMLYKDFNGYEVLPFLSPKQMGEMTLLTKAFKDKLLVAQILVELEKRPSEELQDFMTEFNAVAKQKRLTALPDSQIRDLIFKTAFRTLQLDTFSAEQFSFWFGDQLQLFLPSLSLKDLQMIPLDIDCQSHQNLVAAMNKAYGYFTEELKNAFYGRILSFLQSHQLEQGVKCSPNANSSQWLLNNFGRFSSLGTMAEFLSVNENFNGISAMNELSASQLAELSGQPEALMDGNVLVDIMDNLDTVGDLAEFLDKLNMNAEVDFQNREYASLLLSIAFQKIAANFPRFKSRDYTYWFQGALQNLLYAMNETLLADIPLKISCNSYQQIMKGFNNIHGDIPAEKAPVIFGFSKAFLATKVKSGIACGQPDLGLRDWLEINLGNFSRYADYQDLLNWNLNFDGMAILEYLSPSQLASLTLESEAINTEEKICQILARLQSKPLEDIYQYIDQFNIEAQKRGIISLEEEGIREKMLSQFLEEVESEFVTFSPQNWTHFLSGRLALLLPSAGGKESQAILSRVSGCDSFRAVMSSLSQAYPAMTSTNRESVYASLFTFLENQLKTTGSACASPAWNTAAWLQDNFGAFVANAAYEDFTKLMGNFNGFDVKENLTSAQLAHAFFGSDVLNSPEKVHALLMPLEDRPVEDMVAFMTEFANLASKNGITFLANTEVRDTMFDAIFSKLQSLFATAGPSQYQDWFQKKLALWLPSINASALAAIPKTVPCGIFKTIMASLDNSFKQMSPESQHDVYEFAKNYLSTKTSQGGDPCTENTRGGLDWLVTSFGSFGSLASHKDLVSMNADFRAVDAVAVLTPVQLADYTLASDVLRDVEKAGKVFGSLNSGNIGEFLDAFNAAAEQGGLPKLPNLETKRFILGEIFCHLSGALKLFTPEDYSTWFGQRLRLFLSSLDGQSLGFLPVDVTCPSLAAIVKALTEHHANNTLENPENILSFIKKVLHFQLQNSGSACVQDIGTDRQWLLTFFGPLTEYGSYSDFTVLKSNFKGIDSLDLFSAQTLAQVSTQSHTIYSTAAVANVLKAIRDKTNPEMFLRAYLDEFNDQVLKNPNLLSNTKVRDTMLLAVGEILFPQIASISLEEIETWFQKLSLLLPGINGTMFGLLPLGMPCPYYQKIVKSLDGMYSTLSAKKKQDVYGFQKAYLAAQFADTGSACDGGTSGIRDWLAKNLGEFCSVAKLSELQAFYPDLDGVENLAGQSPTQAADLTIVAQMLHNSTLASLVVEQVKDFPSYAFLYGYLSRLRGHDCQSTLPAEILSSCNRPSPLATLATKTQKVLLSNALFFLKKEGKSVNSSQWTDIYQLLLSSFLPALGMSPHSNETCKIFHDTMKEIAMLHPVLHQRQEELAEVETLCTRSVQQPKLTATTRIPRTAKCPSGDISCTFHGGPMDDFPTGPMSHPSGGIATRIFADHPEKVQGVTEDPENPRVFFRCLSSHMAGDVEGVKGNVLGDVTTHLPGAEGADVHIYTGASHEVPRATANSVPDTNVTDIPVNATIYIPGAALTTATHNTFLVVYGTLLSGLLVMFIL